MTSRRTALLLVGSCLLHFGAVVGPDREPQVVPDPRVTGEDHRIHGVIGSLARSDPLPVPWPSPHPEPQPQRPLSPEPGSLIGEIRFCVGCHDLEPDDRDLLGNLAQLLPPRACVSVEGHADRTVGLVDNRELSRRRAASVADVLADLSIDVRTQAFGDSRPRHRGHEADRRVEIRGRSC